MKLTLQYSLQSATSLQVLASNAFIHNTYSIILCRGDEIFMGYKNNIISLHSVVTSFLEERDWDLGSAVSVLCVRLRHNWGGRGRRKGERSEERRCRERV